MSMDSHEQERPAKRFKHQSHKESLKGVHLPSALIQSKFDLDIADNDSHFHEALTHWKELNLSPQFIKFANAADGLSASMPLLLYNWETLIDLWLGALQGADDEALKALLDVFQKLAHDLRTTLAPKYPAVLKRLVQLLTRSLSAPALTALLATFSALFKYVLIPAVDPELLEQAWSVFRDALPKCSPEVQKAAAEVWGATIRRLKTSAREQCVALVAASAEGPLADACAWILVSACVSTSQMLHTTTVSVFTPLLKYHLACDSPDASYTLIRRVMTALIHHCRGPEQFGVVVNVLIEYLGECAKSPTGDANAERLRRMIEIVTVACIVREGSRIQNDQIIRLGELYLTLPLSDHLHPALLKFGAAVLTRGGMGLWIDAGRKILLHAWERPTLGIELCGILSDTLWDGWRILGMPYIRDNTLQLLQSHPQEMLKLLVALHRQKRLESTDIVWKQRLQTWVDGRLVEWQQTEENVLILHDVLALSSLLPALSPFIIKIIHATLEIPDSSQEYESSFANSGWVLGACLKCLSTRPSAEWDAQVDLVSWTNKIVDKWNWSSGAINGLVSLIRAREPHEEDILSASDLYPSLQTHLLSHSRALRLGTLRLLTSPLVKSSSGAVEVLKRCLQAEEISLDVQGSRERVLRIGRLPLAVKDDDELGAEICCRWLIAQLKVNLRPLWSSAAAALAMLSERFGDLVWRLLFQEVQSASRPAESLAVPEWLNVERGSDSIWEDERSWRDPSAHKMRVVFSQWHEHNGTKVAVIQDQNTDDRFDPTSYEAQLLSTLGECSSLAEKHSRDLIPHFLSFAGPESSSKLPRHKLSVWLTLFSKFVNPKALRSTEVMRSMYISLLSHPDRSLQRLALSCLLTYKSPHLAPHEDMLRSLLDDTRWRDDLTQLDISKIEQADRPELVDVITRLLFGLMLEKRGRSRGADRRAAVLSALGGCTDQELHLLVNLMLQPITNVQAVHRKDEEDFVISIVPEDVSEKQRLGFMTLLGDVLKHLGSRLIECWPALLEALLNLLGDAQARIDSRNHDGRKEEDDEGDEDPDSLEEHEGSSRNTRALRQLGLKRFADFFRCPINFDFGPYILESYRAFISPRLSSLDSENTQSPSALLELFYVWTLQREHARFLVDYDDRTLPKIYACLIATNVKPTVISKVFDVVECILNLSAEDQELRELLLKPHVSLLLTNISILVERTKGITAFSDTLGRRQIAILSQIAPYLTDDKQASTLLELFSPPLRKPAKIVPEKVKADIAIIMSNIFHLIPELADPSSQIYARTFGLLAPLFQTLRSRQARASLITAFRSLAELDTSISYLADLLESLNAYSKKRLDEPDFDRRFEAFTTLNDTLYTSLSPQHWSPILYNMLNFIQDPTELTVRNNASSAMKRFIQAVATATDPQHETMFMKLLYPGLRNGLRSKNEMVRAEILGVISYAISTCHHITFLQEMHILLADGDEEANFFNNVHHIQLHRRTRAVRRLGEHCDAGHLRSTTLAELFVPLIGNFIVSSTSVDHLLVNEAISTTGRMARQLSWGAYFALTQHYLKLSRNKDFSERIYIRALVAILDNFHFPMDELVVEEETMDDPDEAAQDDLEREQEENVDQDLIAIAETKMPRVKPPRTAQIAEAVNRRLLPRLLQHLENRDETEDTLRIPIAVGIVQVARHLPPSTGPAQISKLLTVLSQVLRSKSQETRDLARETLCRIAVILGPSYLPTILREMRAALLRGPHLHVLAFVTHALLVHVTTGDHASLFNVLDDCVSDVAHVSAEVIFGDAGKDVQSDEFKTKMREVRLSSAKALDSFSIVAKFITPTLISNLLLPIRNILKETGTLKVLQQVDDLLKRIAGSLNANEHLVPKELLILCHTLVSQNARFLKDAPQRRRKGGKGNSDAIVQTKRKIDTDTDHYASNSFRFVSFGVDLFITAHRRNRFDFQDSEIIARLEPMVATIGNTLYSDRMQVVVPGMRAAAAILKCPLKSAEKSVPVFIRQILDIIKHAGSTESEVVQTAFKSLATILRDQPAAQVKEKDLIYLLELLSPDLEEPTRQASVFTMLRAIVSRKFVVPEIYDLMDKVAEISVTSQSTQVQELCRGVLLQFLLDYPQGKGRLRNQMTLLAKNLSYVHESGRKSVMELLSAIISKFQVDLVGEYADLLFVALVMVIANDDSPKCREMASELIKNLFARLADPQRNVIMSHVHSWAVQYSNPQLARVSLQICGIIVDLLQKDVSPYIPAMLEDLNGAIRYSAHLLESALAEADDGDLTGQDLEWQISYHALTVFSKLLRISPELATQLDKVDWPAVVGHLVFPHAWTRTASSRLLGLLFSATPVAAPMPDLPESSPFSRLGMEDVAKKLCLQLRSPNLDAALSLQIVKNLFYIGKCFCAIEMPAPAVELGDNDTEAQPVEDDEDGEVFDVPDKQRHPLPWLFSKLSYQARHAQTARRNKASSPENWIHQPASVLKWFAAMVSFMDASQTERFLMHILAPVYRITEDDTIRDPQMGELKTLAIELQDLVQEKVGTTKFASVYNRIRQNVLGVRRERRNARVIQTTTHPEVAAKRKLQRNVLKKESRKRKNQTFAESKGRTKRRRED